MPICSTCNRQLYRSDKGRRLDSRLATITSDKKRRPYRKHLKESCVNCGFVPQHTCQLDVDHIDGNHANNNPSNLQTICANCHRLKTWEERSEERSVGKACEIKC